MLFLDNNLLNYFLQQKTHEQTNTQVKQKDTNTETKTQLKRNTQTCTHKDTNTQKYTHAHRGLGLCNSLAKMCQSYNKLTITLMPNGESACRLKQDSVLQQQTSMRMKGVLHLRQVLVCFVKGSFSYQRKNYTEEKWMLTSLRSPVCNTCLCALHVYVSLVCATSLSAH